MILDLNLSYLLFNLYCHHFAERELVLIKVRVPPGPARAEVMQLVDIFRARVVDVSEKTITLAVTGDAGKASLSTITNTVDVHVSHHSGKLSSV